MGALSAFQRAALNCTQSCSCRVDLAAAHCQSCRHLRVGTLLLLPHSSRGMTCQCKADSLSIMQRSANSKVCNTSTYGKFSSIHLRLPLWAPQSSADR